MKMLNGWHRCQRALRTLNRRTEGSALVEFALALPILLMLLTGIMSFGTALMHYETLAHATADAAQYLVTLRGQTTDPCADAYSAFTAAASPGLDITQVQGFSVQLGSNSAGGKTCSGNQSQMKVGDPATVKAQFPCNVGVYGVSLTPGCMLNSQITEYEN